LADGAFGGGPGTKTVVALNGETVSDANSPMELGYVTLDNDTDVLEVEFPSGAGMFDPQARDADQATEDRGNGIVS
jgi:N-methylhydantoinase B/oxoprolinase/acetone carboxylase alpha subunit